MEMDITVPLKKVNEMIAYMEGRSANRHVLLTDLYQLKDEMESGGTRPMIILAENKCICHKSKDAWKALERAVQAYHLAVEEKLNCPVCKTN